MASIANLTVALSQNADGSFLARFSDGVGFNFVKDDFWQALSSMDRRELFFFIALQAFINNSLNPKTATLSQIQTLLQAKTYPSVTS